MLQGVTGVDFIDDMLTPMSNAYRIVSRAAYESMEGPEAVNGYLRHLGRIDNFDWIPPAIAFFCRHVHEHEQLAMFARDLERLAYMMFILRWNINRRIGRYSKLLQSIERDVDTGGGSEASGLLRVEGDLGAVSAPHRDDAPA